MVERRTIRKRLTPEEWSIIESKRTNSRIEQAEEESKEVPVLPHVHRLPSVLVLDVETLPMEVFVWGLYKQRIPHTNIIHDWTIVSWAAKWLFDSEMMSDVLTPKEAVNRDDKRIMKSLWELLDGADVVVAHNGDRFDLRKANARFIANGFKRPSPYQSIDTLKVTQREFAFSSHKLDYIGEFLANKKKLETNFDLWKSCVAGDAASLKFMSVYNRQDVWLLEEVYLQVRGWIKSHPNLALYGETDVPVCPTCMGEHLNETNPYVTIAGRFQTFQCEDCGAISRMRISDVTFDEKKKMRISTAR